MVEKVKELLTSFGYIFGAGDDTLLKYAAQRVSDMIKNECNMPDVPEGLESAAIDMTAGEFLLAKKTFSPDDLSCCDLSTAVKQLQAGDASTTFAVGGEGSQTPEQRLDKLINRLMSGRKQEIACYRRIKW